MTDSMKKLEELTQLLRFKDMHGNQRGPEYEICTERGTFLFFGVLKSPELAMAKGFASKDTFVPFHIHNGSSEWMGVYRGKMKLVFKSKEPVIVLPGEAVQVSSYEQHALEFDQDTWLWAVTVPGEIGFPCTPRYELPPEE